MRCVACRHFPLTRRNFRFPGNEARSAEVTASLIEPGSSGIVSARRRRTSRVPRTPLPFPPCPPPPSCRSYFIGTLEDGTPGNNPFPGERRRPPRPDVKIVPWLWWIIDSAFVGDTFSARNDLRRRRFPLRSPRSAAFMLRLAPVLHQVSMKLRASLTGNIFINFRPEMLSRQLFTDTKCFEYFRSSFTWSSY